MPLHSPLHDSSSSDAARFDERTGWLMPLDYGDFKREYSATLDHAGLFDCSNAAKLLLRGPDAAMFLGNLSTNDIKALVPGLGCEAYFCDARAKVQFQSWITNISASHDDSTMWVETNPGRNAELARHLDKYLISERVEIVDQTFDFAQMHVAGPKAASVLDILLGDSLAKLGHFAVTTGNLMGHSGCRIRHRDLLGATGFDIVCPVDSSKEIWASIVAAGATPAGSLAFETLRIEAGTPFFGPDIDSNRFVMEVGFATRAVSYSKGCYLGQEPIVMARDRAGHVNRAFLGLKVLEGGPLPAGTVLWRDGVEVGLITSSIDSPRLGLPIALGYIKWKHQEPGTRMEAQTEHAVQPVELLGLPPITKQ